MTHSCAVELAWVSGTNFPHVHAHELHPIDSLKSSERRRARGRVSDCWNTDFFPTTFFVPNTGESIGLTVRGLA